MSGLPARRPSESWEPAVDLRGTEKYRHQFLAGSEVVVYTARRHPIVLTKTISISLGALVLIVAFGMSGGPNNGGGGILGLLLLGVAVYLAASIAEWRFDRIVITNKRVIKVEGIVNRRVSTIPLGKITDTSYRRTLLGRILGYGDMVLDTPGQDKYLPILDKLWNPDRVYRAIVWIAIGGGPQQPPPPPAPQKAPPEPVGPAASGSAPAVGRRKPPGDDDTASLPKSE